MLESAAKPDATLQQILEVSDDLEIMLSVYFIIALLGMLELP